MARRALAGMLLLSTLLLAACGGSDDDANDGASVGSASQTASSSDTSPSTTTQARSLFTATAGGPRSTAPQPGTLQPTATPHILRTPQPTSTLQPTRTPQPTTTPRPTSTATDVPPTSTVEAEPRVEVVSQNVITLAGGIVLFAGEVENVGDWPATAVQLQVELLGDDGQPVGSGEGYADGLTVMPPGARLSYVARVTLADPATTEWASEDVSITFEPADAERVALYTTSLTVNVEGFRPAGSGSGLLELAGTVANTSGGPLRFARVTVASFDGAGAVISVDSYIHNEPIAQDAGFPFAVELFQGALSAEPAGFTVVVEGLKPGA